MGMSFFFKYKQILIYNTKHPMDIEEVTKQEDKTIIMERKEFFEKVLSTNGTTGEMM